MPTFLSCTLAYKQATVTLVNLREEKKNAEKCSLPARMGGKHNIPIIAAVNLELQTAAGGGSDSKDGLVCL